MAARDPLAGADVRRRGAWPLVGVVLGLAGSLICAGAPARGQDAAADPDLQIEEGRVRELLAEGPLVQAVQPAQLLAFQLRSRGDLERASLLVDDVLAAIDEALSEPGIDATEAFHMRFALPYLLLDRAEISRVSGRPDEALDDLDRAEETCLALEATTNLRPHVLGRRAQVLLDQGFFDVAAPLIQLELEQLEARGAGVDELITAHLHRANLRNALGRFDLQIAELGPVLESVDALGEGAASMRADRDQLALRLAIALQELVPRDEARIAAARIELESIWSSPAADETTRRESAVRLALQAMREGRSDEAGTWLACARRILDAGARPGRSASPGDRAWQSALELRLARLRDADPAALAEPVARLEGDVADLLAAWHAQPTRAAGHSHLRYDHKRALLAELMSAQVALHGDEKGAALALAALARAEATGSLHRSLGARLPTLAEVQASLLPAGTGALVYFPNLDRPLVFTVDAAEGVRMFETASERDLSPIALRWTSEIVRSPAGLSKSARAERDASLAARGKQISKMLLPEPVLERLRRWSTVHIVGSDYLDDLPFEALPVEGLGSLGRAKAVGYLPSLAIGLHLAERGTQRPAIQTELCVVSGVRSDPSGDAPQDLTFGPAELEDLASIAKGPVLPLLGPRATLAELRAADLARARVALFLTHGIADFSRERPHGLRLNGKQALWCEDAELLPGPRLVILAVCAAGRGPQREGDGPSGSLGGAFLRAGADCTVLSGADLAYEPALRMTTVLLRELGSGCSTAEALRRARAHLAAEKGTEDPFYWALTRAVGLAHRPVR